MAYVDRVAALGTRIAKCFCIPALVFISACDSPLIQEAQKAEDEGRVISNELMFGMYPQTFRPAQPQYLERDFEAGADFICDEVEAAYERDICAEPDIDWRR